MKKIAVTMILITLAAAVAMPIISGILAQRATVDYLEKVNSDYAENGYDIAIEILKYDRHLFSSEIEWRIAFGSFQNLYGIDEIVFYDRARHGYTGIKSQTSLEKNGWYQSAVKNYLKGNNPLTIVSTFTITGNIESVVSLEQFSIEMAGEQLDIDPGVLVVSGDKDFSKITVDLSWEGMRVQDKLVLDSFELQQNLERVSALIWQGDNTLQLGTLQFPTQSMDAGLQNARMEYTLDYDQTQNTLNLFSEFAVGSMAADIQSMNDWSFIFAVEQLDRVAFENLLRLYIGAVSAMLPQLQDAESAEQQTAILQQQAISVGLQMIGAVEQLLTKGLTVRISKFNAELTDGLLEADLRLMLTDKLSLAQLNELIINPDLSSDFFEMEFELAFPETLIANKTALLTPRNAEMKTGLFISKEGRLIHQSRILDGVSTLNGNQISLKALLN